VSAGSIQKLKAISVREIQGSLRQENRLGFGNSPRQHEGGESAVRGTDRRQGVNVFPDDVLAKYWRLGQGAQQRR
jgi:hypothetical protein